MFLDVICDKNVPFKPKRKVYQITITIRLAMLMGLNVKWWYAKE